MRLVVRVLKNELTLSLLLHILLPHVDASKDNDDDVDDDAKAEPEDEETTEVVSPGEVRQHVRKGHHAAAGDEHEQLVHKRHLVQVVVVERRVSAQGNHHSEREADPHEALDKVLV